MKDITKADTVFMLKSIAIFLVAAAALIAVAVIGYKQFTSLQGKIETVKKTSGTLAQKISILESVNTKLPANIPFLSSAVPDKNAVLLAIDQIKTNAAEQSLVITNLKAGNTIETKGLNKSAVSIELEGPDAAIYAFLDSIEKSLPLMLVDKIKFSKSLDKTEAEMTINVFSVDLPTKIQPLTSAVTDLTGKEESTLQDIATYKLPNFVEITANQEAPKEDPFN